MKRLFVLDSSAFLDGFNPTNLEEITFIMPKSVIAEIKDLNSKARLENYIAARKIIVVWPEEATRKKVRDIATKLGDLVFLSDVDIDVISVALSYKLKNENVSILSNDYTIANISRKLGIKVETYTKKGIKKIKRSVLYCISCGRTFYTKKLLNMKICPICGGRLIRRRINTSWVN